MNRACTRTRDDDQSNRILVVDDNLDLIDEYLRSLGKISAPTPASSKLDDLEKTLFGASGDRRGAAVFEVQSRHQGAAAIDAVAEAVNSGQPYAIVFLDIKMPPGIDGIEAAKKIREIDANINIVIVTGSMSPGPDDLGQDIPPADRIFYFKKPFHAIELRQLAAALCGRWHADLALHKANEILEQRVRDRTKALHQLAYYDPVTDLPNQIKLIDELQMMIESASCKADSTVVVLLDIEQFSFLNETIGYQSGTQLLKMIGQRLVQTLSKDHRVADAIVGRFGADEFACLLPATEPGQITRDRAELLKAVIETPFEVDGRDLHLKVSVGVATHPAHGSNAKTVFRCAESALHRSMRKIGNDIVYYHSEMQVRAKHKFDLQAELRQAIENGEIITYFQPQLSLITGKLVGAEALARWTRPDGSVVPPAKFIPLSEEMGLSDVLFESVMRHVCASLARWKAAGDWNIPISVNLSAHQLRNHNLVDLVRSILNEQGIDEPLINLELTESVLLEDLKSARPILDGLSDLGVGIHIDDFGTGYSSLSYLAELPVQTLKIDQSFIKKLTASSTTARVVQAIIGLSKSLQMEVIAEGIETKQQLQLVTDFEADQAQGFFVAHPMPETDFLRWCDNLNQGSDLVIIKPSEVEN